MKVIIPGHKYELDHLDWNNKTTLQFVDRWHGCDIEWINNQELLRVLIDRVHFMEEELHWDGNKRILENLREALVLHEARALERKVSKWEIIPEHLETGTDWHIIIK